MNLKISNGWLIWKWVDQNRETNYSIRSMKRSNQSLNKICNDLGIDHYDHNYKGVKP